MIEGNKFDMECPKCRQGDGISIQISIWVDLTEDGTDYEGGDHEWDRDNKAICKCGFDGIVSNFMTRRQNGK